MPRSNKPARAAQAELALARLMASIALSDEHALEIEEAPAPRYLPPPPHTPTPTAEIGLALESSAAAPDETPHRAADGISAQSEDTPSSFCPQPSPLGDDTIDPTPTPTQEPAAPSAPSAPTQVATELTDLPDDLLG